MDMTELPANQTSLEQLVSRYFRLKQELEIAYRHTPWHSNSINRLANEVSATERLISMARGAPSEASP
jgi:hypothetical protein